MRWTWGVQEGGGGKEGTGPSSFQGRIGGSGETADDREGAQGGGLKRGEDRYNLKLFGDKSLVDGVIFMEKVQPAAVLVDQEALYSFRWTREL